MIEGLKPYAEYKESGLPWLDVVPKHWDMTPNRALMRDQRQVVGAKAADYTLLSLTLRGVIARDMVNPKGKFPAQFNTYKVVKPEDFVFCLFDIDETPRGVGISPLKGMITGAYDVFSPTHRINPRFLYHYYLFVDEGKLMKPLYTGLRKTIQRGVFASLKAPLPPPDEQAAIVRFLDHANRKIDGFIRAKRKLIGLLNEQKQAIIHRAVTRGLDPDVPLKPSGIPWLGEIPGHWELVPGMMGLREKQVKNIGLGEKRVLSLSYGRIIIKPEEKLYGLVPESFETYQIVSPGDVIVRPTDLQNDQTSLRVGLVKDRGIITCAYICLQTLPPFENEYAYQLLNSYDFQKVFYGLGSGTRQNLRFSDFKRLPLPLPPKAEQVAIAAFISQQSAATLPAIARTEREIALMQEFRTRLTADLVTGKLDAREAAAKLPEVETFPLDLSDPSDESDFSEGTALEEEL
jgi:type I restriction enzyme S subunit